MGGGLEEEGETSAWAVRTLYPECESDSDIKVIGKLEAYHNSQAFTAPTVVDLHRREKSTRRRQSVG